MTDQKEPQYGTIMRFLDNSFAGPAHTAACRPAEHAKGTNYVAPWEDPFAGFPEHCRRSCLALALAGEPVLLRGCSPTPPRGKTVEDDREYDLVLDRMRPLVKNSIGRFEVQIHQFVPTESYLSRLVHHRFIAGDTLKQLNRGKIAYIVLECDRVSSTMVEAFKRLGQVWVTCELTRQALVDSGVPPEMIRIVHMPYRPDEPLFALRGRPRPRDVPRFYHIGKWEPRKAQDRIILAFMRAFRPREAKLLIKTTSPYFPKATQYPETVEHAVELALQDPQVRANGWTRDVIGTSGLRITTAHLPEQAMQALHRWGDVYCSLSHGEGWDMPAFDAMLAGNTCLYTPSGGPQEFLRREHHHVEVPFGRQITSNPCYQRAWAPDACYWDYRIEDAVKGMLNAAALVRGERPIKELPLAFSPERVGQDMLSFVRELEQQNRDRACSTA